MSADGALDVSADGALDVVVTGADLGGPALSRLRISGGRIRAVGPDIDVAGADEVIDVGGGGVVPGLYDHHVHLSAAAAARGSIRLGPPEVVDRAGFAAALADADRWGVPGGWIRGVAYHDAVAGVLDRDVLDRLVAHRPLRIQDRSGTQWVLNSAGLAELPDLPAGDDRVERDGTGRPTGLLTRMDRWLAEALGSEPIAALAPLAVVSAEAARAGVVGFTDATPLEGPGGPDLLVAARRAGDLCQRVTVMSAPGESIEVPTMVTLGPVKVVLDDDRLPDLDGLGAIITAAHHVGRGVAVHCVTRVQSVLTVAAFDMAGSNGRDRVEHGAVIPDDLLGPLARLGVTVVTNPGFVAERGDAYVRDVDPDDAAILYRCASLRGAGIRTAAGTDMPFGPADPWRVMRACVERTTPSGARLGPDERLDGWAALSMFLGSGASPGTPRRIEPGRRADLCVLDRPLDEALRALSADNVALCVIGGEVVADNR